MWGKGHIDLRQDAGFSTGSPARTHKVSTTQSATVPHLGQHRCEIELPEQHGGGSVAQRGDEVQAQRGQRLGGGCVEGGLRLGGAVKQNTNGH